MSGIVYGRFAPGISSEPNQLYLYIYLAAILLSGIAAAVKQQKVLVSLMIAFLFFVTGSIHIEKIHPPDDPSDIYTLTEEPGDATYSGTIHSISSDNRGGGRLLINVDEILRKDGSYSTTHGLLLLRTDFPPPAALEPGHQILARSVISRIRRNTTPGTFDYRQYMADRNIYVTGRIHSPVAINISGTKHLPDRSMDHALQFFQKIRHSVTRFISDSRLADSTKGIYGAILTGERIAIPEQILDDFKKSGGFHLLAISGMHMFLLFLISTFIFNLVLKRSTHVLLRFPAWKLSASLSILPLVYYTAISGTNPPAVRAFIMTFLLIIAVISDRQNSIFNSLCLAAFVILVVDPVALFSPSFQLSFTAVAGMIVFNNSCSLLPDRNGLQSGMFTASISWIRSSLIISLIALAVTAPLTLYYFHQTSFLGPITTMLLAPAICFISLPLGLFASLLHQIFPAVAACLLETGATGIIFAEKVTSVFASIPYAWINQPPPAIIQIIVYYLFLLSFLKIRRSKRIWVLPGSFFLLLLLSPLILNVYASTNSRTRVSFIDVGQGNATLVEFPDRRNVLIDGGSISGEDFNIGERIIAPFLWDKRIKTLDGIVITHAHSDHYNGLEPVIKFFRPKIIWVNGSLGKDPKYQLINALANRYGVKISVAESGQTLLETDEATLRCLKNLNRDLDNSGSENSRSLILEITSYGKSVILPGDIMKGDGRKIIDLITAHTDLLLAPHHGSKSSATEELLETLKPEHLVIASGSDGEKDKVLELFSISNNIQLHSIRNQGTTTFTINPEGLAVKTFPDKWGSP